MKIEKEDIPIVLLGFLIFFVIVAVIGTYFVITKSYTYTEELSGIITKMYVEPYGLNHYYYWIVVDFGSYQEALHISIEEWLLYNIGDTYTKVVSHTVHDTFGEVLAFGGFIGATLTSLSIGSIEK